MYEILFKYFYNLKIILLMLDNCISTKLLILVSHFNQIYISRAFCEVIILSVRGVRYNFFLGRLFIYFFKEKKNVAICEIRQLPSDSFRTNENSKESSQNPNNGWMSLTLPASSKCLFNTQRGDWSTRVTSQYPRAIHAIAFCMQDYHPRV